MKYECSATWNFYWKETERSFRCSLFGKSSGANTGEHSVDDGLADTEEQPLVLRAEHQRLVILLSHWTGGDGGEVYSCMNAMGWKVNHREGARAIVNTFFNESGIKWDVKPSLWLSWRREWMLFKIWFCCQNFSVFFNSASVCTYLFWEDPQQIVRPVCWYYMTYL